jgi:hypothetical protein
LTKCEIEVSPPEKLNDRMNGRKEGTERSERVIFVPYCYGTFLFILIPACTVLIMNDEENLKRLCRSIAKKNPGYFFAGFDDFLLLLIFRGPRSLISADGLSDLLPCSMYSQPNPLLLQ